MFDLRGQTAIVTGAASGIGAATTRRLARAGANLVLAVHSPDGHNADAVLEDVRKVDAKAILVETDVTSTESVNNLVARALSTYGRVDIAVANAAIARRHSVAELDDDAWRTTLNVNLHGVWRLFRAVLPHMSERGYGRLLATSSVAGPFEAWEEHVHYSAAKSGIVGMIRSLAAEVGPSGITVNAVAPGIIETPQTLDDVNSLGSAGIEKTANVQPIRRKGAPEDIAAAFHYLSSPDAGFVTGHLLLVDGGRTLLSA
ncbi:SDR family oxidoreductase [Hoeflea sp. CAU 1731]